MIKVINTDTLQVEQDDNVLMLMRKGEEHLIAAMSITIEELEAIAEAVGVNRRVSDVVNDFLERPVVKAKNEAK